MNEIPKSIKELIIKLNSVVPPENTAELFSSLKIYSGPAPPGLYELLPSSLNALYIDNDNSYWRKSNNAIFIKIF